MSRYACFLIVCIVCIGTVFNVPIAVLGQENLDILSSWKAYNNSQTSLYKEIAREAYQHLDKREQTIASITTIDQYRDYQDHVDIELKGAFGPLPLKTPLNVRTTASFRHEGFLVENVIFESRPGFQVTGCVVKNENARGQLPTVLYVSGHTADGYRSQTYQHVIFNLARKGFLVLAIDPIGQGERYQYYDAEQGKSLIGGSTKEHSFAGLQYLPLGRTVAMVRLWDCIRAVDYLLERDDVDPLRIGVHGRSGGGTMSTYLGAMDDRIAASAPECYITAFRRLFQSIGPQDGEQNLLSEVSRGLDFGDFLVARRERPTLVVATTRDFFSIQGVHETMQSLRSLPEPASNNLFLTYDDAPHQSTKNNRENVYAFFMEAFNVSGSALDENIPFLDADALKVSSSGQVITSGSRTIHELIKEDSHEIIQNLATRRVEEADYKTRICDAAREISGYKAPDVMDDPILTGRFKHAGYSIEKYILDGEGDIPLPALLCVPDGEGPFPSILHVNSGGKSAGFDSTGVVESLVRDGYAVLAVDLPGFGELSVDTSQSDAVIGGVSFNIVFGAQLIGRSIPGIQAGHIIRACRFLESRNDISTESLTCLAQGTAVAAALHAAVLDDSITSLALEDGLLSWIPLVETRYYDNALAYTIVPDAMLQYDLLDLLNVYAPRKLFIFNPVNGESHPVSNDESTRLVQHIGNFYREAPFAYQILRQGDASRYDTLTEWLK